jgi:predicted transcriptional regulator
MRRIQIDLDDKQAAQLKTAARGSSKTLSAIIREAIDEKLARAEKPDDFERALTAAAGIWARRTDVEPVETAVRKLRRDRRGSTPR